MDLAPVIGRGLLVELFDHISGHVSKKQSVNCQAEKQHEKTIFRRIAEE